MGTVVTPLLLIGAICVVTVLVALNKINGRLLYLYIFGISLGLVWQTTMMGVDVVGSDIHNELFFARLNTVQAWDLSYPDSSNTSIVIGILTPWISKLLMMDMVWVFKVILPLILACVPVVLFASFKKMFGEKRAFFATLFFVIVPVYSMEIAQIAKSMVAELFFALMFYAIVSDWKWQYKLLGISGSLIMQSLCHYTIGILGLCFLTGVLLFRLFTLPIKWRLLATRKVPVFVLVISLALGIGVFWGYHGYAANGSAVRSVQEVASNFTSRLPQTTTDDIVEKPTVEKPVDTPAAQRLPHEKPFTERMSEMPSLVKIGTGFDWAGVPNEGKLFRIIQYLTQLLIVIGVGWALFAYKKLPVEYLGLVCASGILLFACVFIPGVSIIINMTRFYHISLFFLAPMFVFGCEAVGSIRR